MPPFSTGRGELSWCHLYSSC